MLETQGLMLHSHFCADFLAVPVIQLAKGRKGIQRHPLLPALWFGGLYIDSLYQN